MPVRQGDRVTMLGHDRPLDREFDGGTQTVRVPAAARAKGRYAWVFKIDWTR
ncbi:hypothetical protein ACIO6U_00745 [Streptomyces sp. NPDC087422]|uniref:hypothetical protein n=1 Tax=Streptomyces sp. NPDC087422 TaxID=3365786 RepID=UPI00380099AD